MRLASNSRFFTVPDLDWWEYRVCALTVGVLAAAIGVVGSVVGDSAGWEQLQQSVASTGEGEPILFYMFPIYDVLK